MNLNLGKVYTAGINFNQKETMILKSINPFTGKVIGEYEEFTDQEIDSCMKHSEEAFHEWKRTTFKYRGELLLNVASQLRGNNELLSATISSEMGKTIRESRAELEKCAWVCEFYSVKAEDFLKPEGIPVDNAYAWVYYEPLGTILGIMPWNFPFWQFFRFAAPTLMAGNVVLLKHDSNVQQCARAIENLFEKAGFPAWVIKNLVIGSERVKNVIENDAVKAVTLTGSELAGSMVAAHAGSYIKKTVLELGGSNSFIVLDDADIAGAVETGIQSKFQNAGQSCIAAKRFILHKNISDEFIERFSQKVSGILYGNPLDENTFMGPLATVKQAETVYYQVKQSVAGGAKLLAGGEPDKALFPPTLVTGVKPGMPLFDEEVFGPVAAFIIAGDDDEAIALANNSKYGLGVSLFTRDAAKAASLVPRFDDGSVFINSMVRSDPRLPFGGTKKSGYGRELSVHGIREFVNVKTVLSG